MNRLKELLENIKQMKMKEFFRVNWIYIKHSFIFVVMLFVELGKSIKTHGPAFYDDFKKRCAVLFESQAKKAIDEMGED